MSTISPYDIFISNELVKGRSTDYQSCNSNLRLDHSAFPRRKSRSKRGTGGRIGAISCSFSPRALVTAQELPTFSSYLIMAFFINGLHFSSLLSQSTRRWYNKDQITSALELVLGTGEGGNLSKRTLASSFSPTYK